MSIVSGHLWVGDLSRGRLAIAERRLARRSHVTGEETNGGDPDQRPSRIRYPTRSSNTSRDSSTAHEFFGMVILAVVVLAVTAGVAQAAELWSDISDAQWVSDYHVTAAEAATVADGFPDGTFRPYADVTRGQFAKMAVTGLGVDTAEPTYPPRTPTSRPPIPSTRSSKGAAAAEMIGGYPDGTYRPDNKIMRQQANSILGKYLAGVEKAARGGIQGDFTTYPTLAGWFAAEGQFYLAGYTDESQISTVHRPATAYLVYRQVTLGSNGMLTPVAFLSRAQAVALVLRTVDVATEVTTPPTRADRRGYAAGRPLEQHAAVRDRPHHLRRPSGRLRHVRRLHDRDRPRHRRRRRPLLGTHPCSG